MPRTIIVMTIILIAIGCQNENARVAELASRHATQQAELSRETVELQTELVEGTHELVVADAEARSDFLEREGKMDERRAEIRRQHDDLDNERRDIAKQKHREPIVANAVIAIGTLLACLLPLAVAAYLLRANLSESDDHSVTEILLQEVTATHPAFRNPGCQNVAHSSSDATPRIYVDQDESPPEDLGPTTNQSNE
jgi:hypothetical protein